MEILIKMIKLLNLPTPANFPKSLYRLNGLYLVFNQKHCLRKETIIFLISILFIFNNSSLAQILQKERPPEYQVKAAFLFNFVKFVEWPDDEHSQPPKPIIIGIVGEDHFGTYLDQIIKNKTVRERHLIVRRFKHYQKITSCHILFISSSERRRLSRILSIVQNNHTLTVGDMKHFAVNGGIINFVMENHKVRFEINLEAAKRAQLKLSSKLLRLATIINDRKRGN